MARLLFRYLSGKYNLSKTEEAEIEAVPNKERYIGEARFLRALAYFDLVRIFGAVPAVTTPVSIELLQSLGTG